MKDFTLDDISPNPYPFVMVLAVALKDARLPPLLKIMSEWKLVILQWEHDGNSEHDGNEGNKTLHDVD